jgi:CheY-like chemotaxis protein
VSRSALAADQRESAQAIGFAAERAANLTRQLLMFSRKNVMQPTLQDLREVIGHTGKLLQRLLGETIHVEFVRPAELPMVMADTGMIEQVLMNLAVNARDAMPKGGKVVIGLRAVTVDEDYMRTHAEARPGHFICLFVSDTGCGMSPETVQRIFEPFFTTKEVGKGTGLGLATVYGIVKQHDGWIEVDSVLNHGTKFEIYLPARAPSTEAKPSLAGPSQAIKGGKETILVVEDEPALRDLAHTILMNCGYHVLQAGSGPEALRVWQQHENSIDLVLTDMVMPEGMSGMDLAQRLNSLKPGLKVVFASGYSMDEMETGFIIKGGSAYLQKPYTHLTLAKAVRDCLDSKA